jgi:hypothetical protein
MKSRALFLMAALLASSAWAQEPSFDLKSDAIRRIVHDTAASQSALVQLAKAPPVEHKLVLVTEAQHPFEAPIKIAPPRRIEKPKPRGPVSDLVDTLVDAVVGTAVDDWLGADEGFPPGGYAKWIACQSVIDSGPSLPPIAACPGVTVPNGK